MKCVLSKTKLEVINEYEDKEVIIRDERINMVSVGTFIVDQWEYGDHFLVDLMLN